MNITNEETLQIAYLYKTMARLLDYNGVEQEHWYNKLKDYICKPSFINLMSEINIRSMFTNVYPEQNNIFNAFRFTPYNKVRVVILGQDPYHQKNQANGLAFSVNNDVKDPPSLQNIKKEIANNFNCNYSEISSDFLHLAKQGVLLLNTALTVEENKPNAHSKLWKEFTNEIIELINQKNNQVIFLLWGNHAKSFKKLITNKKHIILETGHPSPLSASRGLWFGNKHFLKVNELLDKKINWIK